MEHLKKILKFDFSDKYDTRDIYSAIAPLLYFSKALGIAPINCSDGRPTRIATTYSIAVFLTILGWFAYCLLINLWYEYPHSTYTISVPHLLKLVFSFTTVLMCFVLFSTVHRKKFQSIFKRISCVDEILLKPKERSKMIYGKTKIFLILQLLIVIPLYVFISFIVHSIQNNNLEVHFFMEYFVHIIGTVMELQLIDFILLIRHRYSCLNAKLLSLYGISENDMEWNLLSTSNFETHVNEPIPQFVIINNEINETLKTNQKTIKMTFIFLSLTQNLYNALIIAFKLDDTYRNDIVQESVTMFVIWAGVRMLKLICLTTSSQMASGEANRTRVLVQKLLLSSDTECNNLRYFSNQLLHYKLRFTACGFFTLDSTLLQSVAAAVTTYLVILLQ
ncbi:hypothetical protein L9F63_018438, partial [Diploptera punctata]